MRSSAATAVHPWRGRAPCSYCGIGIDIGKNSFHVVGLDARGAIVLRQKWSRGQVEVRLANMPPCLIGMLHIAPFRDDGVTYGTPTWIWSVAVDDALYVRAYNGQDSRWYQAAVRHKAGRVTAAGMTKEARFDDHFGHESETLPR